MDNKIVKQLIEIRKNSVFDKTVNSYVAILSDLFINDFSSFSKTAFEIGMTEEELLNFLKNPSISNVALLDEMLNINLKIEESVKLK